MKKALIALAALGLTGGAAVAQSSVTLFGVVDADMKFVKSGDTKLKKLDSSGLSSSRFGVRGTEDLGGGLKAGFWLEGDVNPDTGTAGSAFWGRRATVSLAGEFGEVRLGRNKTASRLQVEDFDPFSFTGLGSVGAIYSNLGSGNGTSYGRADNLVSYSLPGGLGGFYGGVDISAGEGANANKGQSVRLGYKNGPLHVSGAFASTSNTSDTDKFKLLSIGGAYDLGVARPSLSYTETKYLSRKQQILTAAVTVPLGQGQLVASFTDAKANGAAETSVTGYSAIGDARLLAVGYAYNVSKRTALYTTFSQIDNKGAAKFIVNGAPAAAAGQKSSGFDVGIRHSF